MKAALLSDPSDEQLLAAIGRGERAEFRALVDRYALAVHRVAYRLLGDVTDSKDVTQETFLRLWKQAAGWQPARGGSAGMVTAGRDKPLFGPPATTWAL